MRLYMIFSQLFLKHWSKYDIQTDVIFNKSWKKVVVGKGNATKVDIKNFSIDLIFSDSFLI